MKLRKPASDGLSVKTRTSKLLVENVSERLFDFKARRYVKDADLNGGRSTGHCYSVVAEKNWTGVVVHPFTCAFGRSRIQEDHLNLGVVN